jgi:hypothetical protein
MSSCSEQIREEVWTSFARWGMWENHSVGGHRRSGALRETQSVSVECRSSHRGAGSRRGCLHGVEEDYVQGAKRGGCWLRTNT